MRVKNFSSRHVRLSLSDFEGDPAALTAALAAPDVWVRRKGEPAVQGRARSAERSSIMVLFGFDASVVWDDAFLGLVESIGGIPFLKQFLLQVGARDQHIHFQIPARGSSNQENNYLSRPTLDVLQDLNLWVGFDFSDFDPSDPTHLDPR
jgi:hypothetical protein